MDLRRMIRMLLLLASLLASSAHGAEAATPPVRIQLFATQPGRVTLDEDAGGGNPFASAFLELLGRPELTLGQFQEDIVDLTRRRSDQFQRPDVVRTGSPPGGWRLFPARRGETRIAMLLVYSDYTAAGAVSLPGASHDLRRLAEGLQRAGFEVETLLDPDRDRRDRALSRFAARSRNADVALVYATGHGVEVDGTIYLLPGDFPVREGARALPSHGIRVDGIASGLHARKANFLLYGGCRDNPFR